MKKVKLLNVTALCAFFVAVPVLAESSDFEEILVKGRVLQSDQMNALKIPTPIIDVPQSLSIVTDEDVRKKGFKEIGDIVRYTPGINTSLGEGHRDAVVFRGVRSTADFYQDGVRDDVQYYRPLYNVEQVEVLRGPNALLFGRGGTGGIINRVSKKAVNGKEFKTVDIGIDSFGATDLAADVNTNLSDSVAFRLNMHSDLLENHRDFYYGDRFGINPTVNIALDADTDLDLSYEYIDHERFIDRGIPTANGEPVKALSDIVFGDKNGNLSTLEASVLRAALSHRFSESTKGTLSLTSNSFKKMYQNTYAQSYDPVDEEVTMDGYHDPTERDNLILSANLINELNFGNMTHTILTGFETVKTNNSNLRYDTYWVTQDDRCGDENDDRELFIVNPGSQIDFTVNHVGIETAVEYMGQSCNKALKSSTETDISVSSFYFQDQIEVTDSLMVLLGGRYDKFDIKVADIKKDSSGNSSVARVDTEFSPRFGLIYKPQNNVSVYYSYSESFAPSSGEQFKGASTGKDNSWEKLKPQYYETSEVGLKLDLNNSLSLTTAYFESEAEIEDYDNNNSEYISKRGLSVDGFELELKGQINDNLNVAFSYSNLDGETAKGGQPREIPESTYSIWTSYDVNPNFGWALGVIHQGESFVSDDDAIKQDIEGIDDPIEVLPAYTRVDAAVYYSIADDLKIQLNVENLSDEVYFPHSHSTHQVAVGESRNARLSLSKTF
jgi:catecholate siderophore receptor